MVLLAMVAAQGTTQIQIEKGSLLVYRVFEIAEEIDLAKAQSVLSQLKEIGRLSISRGARQELVIRNAPITITMPVTHLSIGNADIEAETSAKVWDYGVLSVAFQFPINPGSTHKDLLELAIGIENSKSIDEQARARAKEIADNLGSALQDPHMWETAEDYFLFLIEKISGVDRVEELLTHKDFDIATLLLAEPAELSDRAREAMLVNHHQYTKQDLVVLDWNSAWVLEPTGRRDIPDVIEFALTHLLEMRYYDDLLDVRLGVLYDAIEKGRRNFSTLYHDAGSFYVEVSEFLERVDNSLKVIGDSYYATIFRNAAKRFRLWDWEQNATRKLNILATVSQILQGELNAKRSHLLEIIVVILISFEIVSALFH